MAKKKSLFGVNNFIKKTRRKRPGRHSKSPNKSKRKMHKAKYRGQGKNMSKRFEEQEGLIKQPIILTI